MSRGAHGLVIGKFYPPHAGHHHLVRVAAAHAERVTVVVMASSVESIALADRVAWMREVHVDDRRVTVTGIVDDVPMDFGSDSIWRAHVELMQQAVRSVTDQPVDTVLTSEAYGDELGRRLGARHVLVDLARERFPVSGTAVRRDPIAHWPSLAPCVRAGLGLRVVLVGAESTGKTTLAAELAEALRASAPLRGRAFADTRWVPEAGRDATLEKLTALGPSARMEELAWRTPDFVSIAERQADAEERAARSGGPVLVCDTDAFATGVWHERYLGARNEVVERVAREHRARLYLVTHHDDVPFVQDGIRDGEHLRQWMTERFVERLAERGHRWAWIRGAREERREAALALVDRALADALRFADPLG